jgi:hypothetical protein
MPKKTQRMVYAKGKSVFELIDPDGHIYVLQAHDAQFPIELAGDSYYWKAATVIIPDF